MTENQWEITARDGVRLVADRLGDPQSPAVILAHGGGQTRHSWHEAAAMFAAHGYSVINLDLRGHGDSAWADDGRYGIDDFAGDLAEICGSLDHDFALVGASLGGLSALTAVNNGLRPRALVLVDIVPKPDMDGIKRITDFMSAHHDGFATVDDAVEAVRAYNPHRSRPPRAEGLARNLRARDGRLFWHWDPGVIGMDPHVLHERVEADTRRAQWSGTVPTLLVRGMGSDVVSDEGVAALKALIPNLSVANVAAAGHMVAGDDNDSFNAAVGAFLEQHMPVRIGSE